MGSAELPPGFRFHPTDEELIMYYLSNQATSKPCPVSIIPEVDIYKFDPWQLPEKAEFGENEWYFFTPRDRKYPNGVRPNRATVSGYWKATGTDKAIYSASKYVGVKKALVFYKGRPPKGLKTDWIMHEYRLIDSKKQASKQVGSMRLDDWVLCRIYKKRHMGRANLEEKMVGSTSGQFDTETCAATNGHSIVGVNEQQQMLKMPGTWSLSHILEMDLGPISQLLSDHSCNTTSLSFQNNIGNAGSAGQADQKVQLGDMPYQYLDSGKLQMNQSSFLNQPFFMNPMTFEFQ